MTRMTTTLRCTLFAACLMAPVAFATAGAPSFGGFDILYTVQVDDQVCAAGAVQCSQLGEPGNETPADGNRAPVQIVVQLLNPDLDPLLGLAEEDFSVGDQLVVAGGSTVEAVSCPNCFSSLAGGTYRFFVQPFGTNLWKAGTHNLQILVDVGPKTLRALTQIEIPDAP